MGRPRKGANVRQTVTLSLDPVVLADFDAYLARRPARVSRSEAVERAMRSVLAAERRRAVEPRFK